jgi:hypothetical protein
MHIITDIEEAQRALDDMVADVTADMGEDAADAGFADLVRSAMIDCTHEVAVELQRRNLGFPLGDEEDTFR